jgi:hypothetical protein
MSRLTVFLARSIGLFIILLVAGLFVRGGTVIETTAADGPLMLWLRHYQPCDGRCDGRWP